MWPVALKLRQLRRLIALSCVFLAAHTSFPSRFAAVSNPAEFFDEAHPGRGGPSSDELNRAIALATDYIVRSCGADGKFVYRVEIDSGKESPSYDIIRHAGAIYALAMANQYHPDTKVVDAMIRAAGFLRRNYMGAGPRSDQLVVWSKSLSEIPTRQYAELGGGGLGLVALAAVRNVDPKAVPLSDLQALGRFVMFLQREDGSFLHKYGQESGPVSTWVSLYYPGEAAFGLIALYEADHEKQWLVAAARALSYLARSRTGLATLPADHWALIASARLFPYIDQVEQIVSRDELSRHAIQICESILHDQFRGGVAAGLDGAFDAEGRTAPAATRLEGLLSTLEFLPQSEKIRERIVDSAPRGIAFLLRVQVTAGQQAGGMPGAVVNRARDSADIRIDFVQHALCAWLRYQNATSEGMMFWGFRTASLTRGNRVASGALGPLAPGNGQS